MRYKSICHVSRNEAGIEQLEIEREVGIVERLVGAVTTLNIHQPKTVVDTYVMDGLWWIEKDTRVVVKPMKQYELCSICNEIKKYGDDLTF